MPIVGGLDIHRKQLTFDYLDTELGLGDQLGYVRIVQGLVLLG